MKKNIPTWVFPSLPPFIKEPKYETPRTEEQIIKYGLFFNSDNIFLKTIFFGISLIVKTKKMVKIKRFPIQVDPLVGKETYQHIHKTQKR